MLMVWPANSPDLNIIEHAWDMLGRSVKSVKLTSVKKLALALQVARAEIPYQEIRKLYRSTSSQVHTVISAQGRATR